MVDSEQETVNDHFKDTGTFLAILSSNKYTSELQGKTINKLHSSTRKAPLEENHLTLYLHFMVTHRLMALINNCYW